MRLTSDQVSTILGTALRLSGEDVVVYLFGSRLDDRARGGDVDLFESLAAMNERFAKLQTLIPGLYANAARFIRYSREALGIPPLHGDYAEEFTAIAGDLDLLT